jgi:predicted ATPase
MMLQGDVFALTGKPAQAVQTLTSGITAYRSTGATVVLPWHLSNLAHAHAELGQFDDAWRCIGEAMTAIEMTKETWYEADIHRIAGEIALISPEPDAAKAEAYFERALAVARKQQAKSWELRGDEHGAAVARSGQAAASSRTAGSGLWLVHRSASTRSI